MTDTDLGALSVTSQPGAMLDLAVARGSEFLVLEATFEQIADGIAINVARKAKVFGPGTCPF